MPSPMTSTRPGTRRRSPAWETAIPPASSAPTISSSVPSATLGRDRGDGDQDAATGEDRGEHEPALALLALGGELLGLGLGRRGHVGASGGHGLHAPRAGRLRPWGPLPIPSRRRARHHGAMTLLQRVIAGNALVVFVGALILALSP